MRPESSQSLIKEVRARRLETLRLCFVDQHGILRGKTIVAEALPAALTSGIGVPSTLLLKDTSHRTVFPIWSEGMHVGDLPLGGAGDVRLRPDPEGLVPLPWSPHSALLLCDVVDREGAPVAFSSSAVLQRAVSDLTRAGYSATFGLEVEFQVFHREDAGLAHSQASMPPAPPRTRNLTPGNQYLTETRYDAAEEVLDALRRTAEQMGLEPRSVEIEMGPSQFEFTFAAGPPEVQAARYVLFRTMVREVCHRRGLHASFMAKPGLPNAAANGWHIHQSVSELATGQPVFMPLPDGSLPDKASAWIAGLLDHAAASCLLTNPTVNSYKRFAPFQLAPNRVQWGRDNRGAMIRALMTPGDPASRIENRVADSSANPYFALASQIHAGLSGLRAGQGAPAPSEAPYDDAAQRLPGSLLDAIDAFETSGHVRDCFGADVQAYLAHLKRAEWDRYLMTISEWEHQEYFGLF